MSDIAIRVANLSKRYQIGRAQQRHDTLRDALVAGLRAPAEWFRRGGRDDEAETLWALRDVSFEVKRGEVVGIIGRNGAGKSTLLKILSRITEPTSGEVDLHGRVASLLEVGTGFHPELTGRENVYLNGAILGMRRAEIARKFDEIVAFAEIEKFLDTPVKHYSSGMYVRLAFAVAAHLEPEILVVDEVLAVGDFRFQTKCLNKMQDVSSGGSTVLFVSHNMGAIHQLCSRCIFLGYGKIMTDGSVDSAIQTYVSQGTEKRPEFVLPDATDKPIHLRRIRLTTQSGELASEFRYDQEIKVSIEYEVNRQIAGCNIWIGIRTADESIAFGTADSDTDRSLINLRVPGYYRTAVVLPARWLNAGRYHLVVGIVQSGVASLERFDVLGFAILDIDVPERGRPGILQPLLMWNTVKIPHPLTSESGPV